MEQQTENPTTKKELNVSMQAIVDHARRKPIEKLSYTELKAEAISYDLPYAGVPISKLKSDVEKGRVIFKQKKEAIPRAADMQPITEKAKTEQTQTTETQTKNEEEMRTKKEKKPDAATGGGPKILAGSIQMVMNGKDKAQLLKAGFTERAFGRATRHVKKFADVFNMLLDHKPDSVITDKTKVKVKDLNKCKKIVALFK